MPQSQSERLEAYFLEIIEGRDTTRSGRAVAWALTQLSRLFGAVVQTRLWLYRRGIARHHTVGCQVISVGNLTVGGTGKTPVVEAFARSLQKSGRKVAILSRGYKRVKPPFLQRVARKFRLSGKEDPPLVVSNGTRLLLDSATSGDEPFMLAGNLPDVAVLVDKDRVKSSRYAIRELGCDTLILDDGFQYLSLKHRLDIVLVDRTNPFGNRRVLPRGLLREPVRNIRRAGFIFITKSNGDGAEDLKRELREMNPDAEISECRHCARHLQDVYTGERKELDSLQGLKVGAVSGIAVPTGFEKELASRGAEIVYCRRYADHHRYTQREIIVMINTSLEKGADCVITTEKDAVRFPFMERRDLPVYFLRVEIEMLSGTEAFNDWISRICFR